ncbi:hypothetical protein PWY87_33180 [Kribbella solani]|uniref:hypothetical protein n=1 Tax=Kribbella solani TaxID=236067 RepID=UPI0029A0AF18|nr:hypothetical protein [Kribbella solani]MDX3006576.1 hypothetical protein [Kribbella solani]
MGRTPDRLHATRSGSAGARASYRWTRAAALSAALLAGLLLAGCSDGAEAGGASSPSATPSSDKDRGLAFAKCMRENGVKDFPDPGDDGSQVMGKNSGIDPTSAAFKKAQEACKDLIPQIDNEAVSGEPADLTKAKVWAQCVREHGVPQLPDPEIQGKVAVVDMTNVPNNPGGPLDAALEACEDKRPSGNLRMQSGGGK